MYAQMRTIQDRVGREKFPLVPLNFYSTPDSMVINENFPAVVKVTRFSRIALPIINLHELWSG